MKLKCLFFKVFLFILLILPGFAAKGSKAGGEKNDLEPHHLRVVWKEKPQTTVTLSWSTVGEGKSHIAYLDTKKRMGNDKKYKMKFKAHRNGEYTLSDKEKEKEVTSKWYHHVVVPKLKPSTVYYFMVSSDDNSSREFHFKTAPDDDRDFTLLFGGDSRSGVKSRQQVNRMMAAMHKSNDKIIALAHGGDYIANGQSWSQWNQWLTDQEILIQKDGQVLPIIPARGNHDKGPLYKEIFDIADKEVCYFNTVLNATSHLITLNSENSVAGEQLKFLEMTLKKNAKRQWSLAQYHRPVYPAVKGPGRAKKFWVPLFEKYNLDIALEADGHCIKRTVPIRAGKHDPTGVVYLGEGGLGVHQRGPKKDRWYLQPPGTALRGHHVMQLDFSKNKIEYKAVLLNGKTADSYTFRPREEISSR